MCNDRKTAEGQLYCRRLGPTTAYHNNTATANYYTTDNNTGNDIGGRTRDGGRYPGQTGGPKSASCSKTNGNHPLVEERTINNNGYNFYKRTYNISTIVKRHYPRLEQQYQGKGNLDPNESKESSLHQRARQIMLAIYLQ
jgi:hypothetical protein